MLVVDDVYVVGGKMKRRGIEEEKKKLIKHTTNNLNPIRQMPQVAMLMMQQERYNRLRGSDVSWRIPLQGPVTPSFDSRTCCHGYGILITPWWC